MFMNNSVSLSSHVYFSFQIDALNPYLLNLQIYCTSNSEEHGKINFPFGIKPNCSVFTKEHNFHGTDSSAVKLFIKFKQQHDDDPFFIKSPQSQVSSSDNTTPS